MDVKNIDKVRVMLPHWIEHNQGHTAEFSTWAEKLVTDTPEVAALLRRAVDSLEKAQSALEEALARGGGPLDDAAAHHGHHHDDHHHHHN